MTALHHVLQETIKSRYDPSKRILPWLVGEHVPRSNMKDNPLPRVQILLAWRIDINAQDHCGNTALHLACWSGLKEVVHVLLIAGADMTLKDERDCIPLDTTKDEDIRQILEAEPPDPFTADQLADKDR